MGRVNQAMRRARESGVTTEFESLARGAGNASALAAEPFPAEATQEPEPAAPEAPVAPAAPKANARPHNEDSELQELFFKTYSDKVWDGPSETESRLLRLLAKVERHHRS